VLNEKKAKEMDLPIGPTNSPDISDGKGGPDMAQWLEYTAKESPNKQQKAALCSRRTNGERKRVV
jgi:hypothetical protein